LPWGAVQGSDRAVGSRNELVSARQDLEVVNVAVPELSSVTLARTVLPSMKLTIPVGVADSWSFWKTAPFLP
jgi:hypothetical protein